MFEPLDNAAQAAQNAAGSGCLGRNTVSETGPAPAAPEAASVQEPEIVLSYCGMLVPDDSPLLNDPEWLAGAIFSRSEDDYERPLLKLSVHPQLADQEAIDFIKRRAMLAAAPASGPSEQAVRIAKEFIRAYDADPCSDEAVSLGGTTLEREHAIVCREILRLRGGK